MRVNVSADRKPAISRNPQENDVRTTDDQVPLPRTTSDRSCTCHLLKRARDRRNYVERANQYLREQRERINPLVNAIAARPNDSYVRAGLSRRLTDYRQLSELIRARNDRTESEAKLRIVHPGRQRMVSSCRSLEPFPVDLLYFLASVRRLK